METSSKVFGIEETLEKFRRMDYGALNDTFRAAIKDAVEKMKSAALSSLRSTGINVNAPTHTYRKGKKYTYDPLIKGVKGGIKNDATAGRVRIAPASKKGWIDDSQADDFALKWFELGTGARYTGQRTKKRKDKVTGQYTNRTTKKKGANHMYRGSIKPYGFFDKAMNTSGQQANDELGKNITKAIENIWNS